MRQVSHPAPNSLHRKRRVEVACTICRAKKSRCDGQRPSCSTCTRAALDCTYERPGPPDDQPSTTTRRRARLRSSDLSPKVTTISPSFSCETEGVGGDDNQQAVDTLAIPSSGESARRIVCHFGPTSNHVLFRKLSERFIDYTTTKSSSHAPFISNGNSNGTSRQVSPPSDTNAAHVKEEPHHPRRFHSEFIQQPSPSPQEAEALIDQYEITIGATLPILNRTDLVSPHETRSSPVRALFCIIYALVSGLTCDNTTANAFQRQSTLSLLDSGLFRGSMLESIQVLVLNCVFLQNNQRSFESWTYHAMAVKTCYQLGLHIPTSYHQYGVHERELRKRVWYSVVNQDRALSVALGRPFLIPSQYVRTEMPKCQMSNEASDKPRNYPALEVLAYFNSLVAIHNMKGRITDSLYSSNIPFEEQDQSYGEILTERLRLNIRLEQWRDEISLFGKVLTFADIRDWTESSFVEHRFQVLLSIQFYSTKLLLNAPVLTGFLQLRKTKTSYSAEQIAVLNSALATIEADYVVSEDFRSLIYAVNEQAPQFLAANATWWICNFCAFSIVLHILGILLACQTIEGEIYVQTIKTTTVRKSLDSALETLKSIGGTSSMSAKAYSCIQNFLRVYDTLEVSHRKVPDDILSPAMTSDLAPMFEPVVGAPLSLIPDGPFPEFLSQAAEEFLLDFSETDLTSSDSW
ncbi:fungal-specific transcription factor domain-containing protein [Xylariaceae sp. FL1272]|nr:fungal-specific transcription factor domain-containing protein [Xylariaceae sp. FL1272]